jgi:hypothetical protein
MEREPGQMTTDQGSALGTASLEPSLHEFVEQRVEAAMLEVGENDRARGEAGVSVLARPLAC